MMAFKLDKLGMRTGPKVIQLLYSCSTQQSMKFIMLINVQMPTVVGILTLISMINTTYESLKSRKVCFSAFKIFEQLKIHAQLSGGQHEKNNSRSTYTSDLRNLQSNDPLKAFANLISELVTLFKQAQAYGTIFMLLMYALVKSYNMVNIMKLLPVMNHKL